MIRKRIRPKSSPFSKIIPRVVNFFTTHTDETTVKEDRNKRIALKRNRMYMIIFIIALCVYGLGLAVYLLKPGSILSSITKPPKVIVNPITQEGTVQSFQDILHAKNIVLDSLDVASDEATLIGKKDNMKIYFNRYKNIEFQIDTLRQILQRITINGGLSAGDTKKPKRIDLRFLKPVIEY